MTQNIKNTLKERGVPQEIINRMSDVELYSIIELVYNWDFQQATSRWTWEDCPQSLKEAYFLS